MPHPRSQRIRRGHRAALAASGSVALIVATTPGAAAPAPGAIPPTAPPVACALPGPEGREGLSEAITTPAAPGAPAVPGHAPTTGTVSALTVFIDFPDAEATVTTRERFAEFFPQTTGYLATSSYGRLRYRPAPVHRWLRMSQPFGAYGIDRGAGWHPKDPQGYNRLMREIVTAIGDEVNFADHDLVNVLATPEAGPPATEQVLSVTFPGRPLVDTPTGALRNVSFIWSRQPGESPHRVLVHENGHSFGLPDLYWTGPATGATAAATTTAHPPRLTGHWDVMEQDWGPSNDLLAWHKWKLGWLTARQVACVTHHGTTEHLLTPTGTRSRGTKLVTVRTGRHTALALEVRAPGGLDRVVCRPGLLVSRISSRTPSGSGPIRVADATPGSDGCQPVPDPQVTAALTDAPFVPGETFHDERTGVSVTILTAGPDGEHRIRVTRR